MTGISVRTGSNFQYFLLQRNVAKLHRTSISSYISCSVNPVDAETCDLTADLSTFYLIDEALHFNKAREKSIHIYC